MTSLLTSDVVVSGRAGDERSDGPSPRTEAAAAAAETLEAADVEESLEAAEAEEPVEADDPVLARLMLARLALGLTLMLAEFEPLISGTAA